MTSSSDLSWNSHVDGIVSKARKRVFLIYQLKRAGIEQCELVRIYISVIMQVVEYACPAWHTNLPKYLSDNIEFIQKRCMKTIFPGCSYDDILEMTNLPTLHDRRTTLCRAYFNKMNRSKMFFVNCFKYIAVPSKVQNYGAVTRMDLIDV